MQSPLQITVTKSQVIIEDLSFSRQLVEKEFPEYWELLKDGDKKILGASYIIGNKDNGVKYTDGSFKEWPTESQALNLFALSKHDIASQKIHLDEQKKDKQKKKEETFYITDHQIFRAPFSDRPALIKQYNLERGRDKFYSVDDINNWLTSRKNEYLSNCDWTQLPDVDLTDEEKNEWKEYRALLRKLNKSSDPINEITIPTRPDRR